jgi:hypothetical protein
MTEAPQDWESRAEYDHYAAQYWAMKRKHDGYREPLSPAQHILHLLLTVFTCGLWGIVWIIRASRGNRVPGDATAPIPAWPPPGRHAAPPSAQASN